MYRPNFCAECGEKIVRARWRLWTSRRFCPNCEGRFRKAQFMLPLFAALTLLSIGMVLGRATRKEVAPPLLTLQLAESPTASQGSTQKKGSEATDAEDAYGADAASSAQKPEPKYGPDGTANERPTDPEEVVSICGARTQKGTPCQRRVRGTGRCWQHRGMPAILPQEKLIVTGK